MILIFITVINAKPSLHYNMYIDIPPRRRPLPTANGPVWVSCRGERTSDLLVTREDENKETGHYIKTR